MLPQMPFPALYLLNAVHSDEELAVVDFRAMAEAQEKDPALEQLKSDSSLQFQQLPLAPSDDAFITCDVSTGVPRPYVRPVGLCGHESTLMSAYGLKHVFSLKCTAIFPSLFQHICNT